MPTTTLRGDTIDMAATRAWALVAFYENLGPLAMFARSDEQAPFRLNNTGIIQQTGTVFNAPKFNRIANLIQRRDLTNAGAATTINLTSRNDAGIRQSNKIKNILVADSIFKQNGITQELVERHLGKMIGEEWALAFRKKLIAIAMALVGTMTSDLHTYSNYAASGTKGNLTTTVLNLALSKMGDRMDFLRESGGWIMESKAWTDLLGYQVGSTAAFLFGKELAGSNASPLTLNMPYAQADDPSLEVTNSSNFLKKYTLGVGPGLLDVEFEGITLYEPFFDRSLENPSWVYTGSIEMLFQANGFKYDAANAGTNPTDTVLGTASSWLPQYGSHKEIPAVRVEGNTSVE